MDKQIRSIEKKIKKDTTQEEKKLKTLEKADVKRDRFVDAGKKALKGKRK